ncbi:TonB-dependent receptor plug domain-containing protein [Hanstruepera ponticola]|uniref:TonB-dependent receptor plug domain-containing protein n=1 Tax=Hanstruepera ponticola TaxID=2042995 RepID=UPI000CF0BD4E|nr:TonB-dependent receptor plug domain-containing protein [Hanstruepera ponticola]
MSSIKTIIITCLFLCNFLLVRAQNQTNKEPLSDVLEMLSEQYQVRFSYADEHVIGKTVRLPDEDLSLETLITFLQKETLLVFQQIGTNNYVIRNSITDTQFLDEVLITKFLTEGISIKTDGTSEINLDEFGILPGLIEPDVLQTIQALPGITSVDERVSNLNIRGGTNDQNLIMWDGIKMYQSGHFFGLISAFNPSLINAVSISKNGTSAQFGDGVSGIINMHSSDSIHDKVQGGFGSNLIAADGYIKVPITKKIGVQVSARRSLTDVFNTPTYNQYFDRIFQDSDLTQQNSNRITQDERFYFYDVSSKVILKPTTKDQITISGLKIFNSLDYHETSIANSFSQSSTSKLIQESMALGFEYKRNWQSKLQTTITASLSNYDLNSKNNDVSNNQRLIQENDVRDNRFEFQANYQINGNLNYLGGYQYAEIGMSNLEDVSNPEYRRYVKEVLRAHGLFNEVSFKSNSGKTYARLGLRANYIEQFSDFFMEPRLAINQKISKNFRLELLAELKSQTASQIIDLQDDFLGVEKRRWILSNNDDIPIIQSQQLSLGTHYKKKSLLVSLEGYIKQVEGITSRSQGFQNQYQYTNTSGTYIISGLDFLINQQFDNWSTWLSYSLSKNDYTFNDLNNGIDFPNNIDIRHQITFAGTYSINNLKLALGMNWHSGRPTTGYNTENPIAIGNINYNEPNSSNLSSYFRTDCSATYKFKLTKKWQAHLGASIWNLFNSKNTINNYYQLNNQNTVTEINTQSLGITPNLTFKISF